MKRRDFGLASAAMLLGSSAARAADTEEGAFTLVGATLLRPDGPPLPDVSITVDRGVIEAVGKGEARGRRIDVQGKLVTAGFVDLLTQVGLVEVALEPETREGSSPTSDPIRAAFRAADAYNAASWVIPETRREGITSVGAVPNEGLVAGQSAWADLDGEVAEDALASRSLALHVDLRGGTARGSASVAAGLRRLREAFEDARLLAKNRAAFERNQSRPLVADRLDLDALHLALSGAIPMAFHVDRAADIAAVLDLARTEKLRIVIASGAEAWRLAPRLARERIPVIVHPLTDGAPSFDALHADEANAARLARAGVPLVLSTGETHHARKLRQEAGNAIRAGLSPEIALDAVTRAPARAVGMAGRYGTVEKGKVANVVVWSGDPFELSTRAEQVFIRGRSVSLHSRQTALFAKYR